MGIASQDSSLLLIYGFEIWRCKAIRIFVPSAINQQISVQQISNQSR